MGIYLPSPILFSLSLDFSQHIIQSSQLWGDGVYLDPDSVRIRPGHPGPLEGLIALPLSPHVRETPNGAWQSRVGGVRLGSNFSGVHGVVALMLQSLLKLTLQQFVPPLQPQAVGSS